MMIVLTVQLDSCLSILFGNSAVRWVLDNYVHMIMKNFRDVFSENIT